MPVESCTHDITQQMVNWRRAIHSYPETAYTEFETAKLVADVLRNVGIEVHENIAVTGVVGVLRCGTSERSIGLRADMDALDIQELNNFSHVSKNPGKMHACGHDGHTAMLLGAAATLAGTRNFDGTVYFIFQPAEENEGGGKRMLEEGLIERFPMQEIYGMHNMPMLPIGHFAICPGPMMAGFSSFYCRVQGKGTHSSMPELGIDPLPIGMEIYDAWRSLEKFYNNQGHEIVLSSTQFHGGTAINIIPDFAEISGSVRLFSENLNTQLSADMKSVANIICKKYGAACQFEYHTLYPVLVNSPQQTTFAANIAAGLVGEENVTRDMSPLNGSEDFAYLLQAKRGAYILIGNAGDSRGGCMVHNPHYDFNDDILELGASYWTKLVEVALSAR